MKSSTNSSISERPYGGSAQGWNAARPAAAAGGTSVVVTNVFFLNSCEGCLRCLVCWTYFNCWNCWIFAILEFNKSLSFQKKQGYLASGASPRLNARFPEERQNKENTWFGFWPMWIGCEQEFVERAYFRDTRKCADFQQKRSYFNNLLCIVWQELVCNWANRYTIWCLCFMNRAS